MENDCWGPIAREVLRGATKNGQSFGEWAKEIHQTVRNKTKEKIHYPTLPQKYSATIRPSRKKNPRLVKCWLPYKLGRKEFHTLKETIRYVKRKSAKHDLFIKNLIIEDASGRCFVSLTYSEQFVVDNQDIDVVQEYVFFSAHGKPACIIRGRLTYFHELLFGRNKEVQFKDGNGMNNTRRNILLL